MQNLTPTPLASRPASSPLQRILGRSIRVRLILGATLVLTAFVAVAGWAVQRAHTDSVRAAHFAQLQSTVYLLLAGAEVDADGALVMPPSFPEPRLSLPGSGLYASVHNSGRDTAWRSASTVNLSPPFLRDIPVGEWRFDSPAANGRDYLAVAYGVRWAVGTRTVVLELSVLEDGAQENEVVEIGLPYFGGVSSPQLKTVHPLGKSPVLEDGAGFRREVSAFARTLWAWLGGAGLLLLLSQAVLLQWGL